MDVPEWSQSLSSVLVRGGTQAGGGAGPGRRAGSSTRSVISRFAPSTTGEAHPGTLLAALLVWLDVRSRGGRAILRLEDLDVTRTRAIWADQMIDACAWLGLDWDEVVVQSGRRAAHEAALDVLASAGRLYPCRCSRSDRVA